MRYDRTGYVESVDGVSLFYGESGTGGPTLILNDGIGCEGFAWRYLMPRLATRHRVIHWNYRAHGRSRSPRGMEGLDLPSLARDLLTLMDGLDIDRAVLVGHSMGTQVELEAYRAAPRRVAALALVCGSYGRITHTFHGTDVLHRVLPLVRALVERHRGTARGMWSRVPPALAYRLGLLTGEIDSALFREADFVRYWEHISVMDPDRFLTLLDAAGNHTAEDLLPDVRVPTLVIAAEEDTFTPPALAAHMAALIPDAEHFVVPGASHGAPVEQPEAIALRIEKFLRERLPQTS